MILKGLAAEIVEYLVLVPMMIIRLAMPLVLTVLLIIFLVKGIKYFNKKRDK